jgi:hypothetical protein
MEETNLADTLIAAVDFSQHTSVIEGVGTAAISIFLAIGVFYIVKKMVSGSR